MCMPCQAESLAGHKLLLALCDRETAPRSKDEFFITDLVGLRATAADTQQLLGIVTEVRVLGTVAAVGRQERQGCLLNN